jgi:hypothetical protein
MRGSSASSIRRAAVTLACVVAVTATAASGTAFAANAPTGRAIRTLDVRVSGRWGGMTAAPDMVEGRPLSVWTGRLMIVFGRHHLAPSAHFPDVGRNVNVALAYNPGVDRWRRLTPAPGPVGSYEGRTAVVWTGREMLVWGPLTALAYNPSTNRWRQLPPSPIGRPAGMVVWTGREMIGWGGGCCGDAFADGAAYNPARNTWRGLPASPLAPSQQPIGVWSGRELILFVGGLDTNGTPWPARLARAAAYDPVTDTWRRIAALPARRDNADVVWDGREVLVVGGSRAPRGAGPPVLARVGLAYDPGANRWRRLPAIESGRTGAAAVWTGTRLLLWGGQTTPVGERVTPSNGLVYDPGANRWSALPAGPLLGRNDPAAEWTGHLMLVWGGTDPYGHALADGARFRPTR